MSAKDKSLPLSVVKKLPYKTLMRMINKAKKYLKSNEIMQKVFKDYDVDINEIDFIPTYFKDLSVSAKTDHGIVYLNYSLLTDVDFFKDYSYLAHEYTHWVQQTSGKKATTSSDDGNYLDNKYEQEAFTKQVSYISDQFGQEEAEQYVDDLLDHHDITNKNKKNELEKVLLKEV